MWKWIGGFDGGESHVQRRACGPDVLVSEHQHCPRPEMGKSPRDPRRRSVADEQIRRWVRQRSPTDRR